MSGLNSALNIAKTSLAAQLYGMQVTGNNIANVNTKGYTRQRVNLTPAASIDLGNRMIIGSGVTVEQIQRIRNELLDIQIRSENGSEGMWTAIMNTLGEIETVFNEASNGTLGDMMNEFWNSWYDLSNDPESLVVKNMVKDQGIMLANRFNELSLTMSDMRSNINTALSTMVDQVNSISTRILDLNQKIQQQEGGGNQQANDCRDQRDLLLDELSELVNISTVEMNDGTVSVYVSGSLLVSSSTMREMAVNPNAEGMYDVSWSDTGTQVDLIEGKIKGHLDSRDVIIPKYLDRIDTLAQSMIENVNRLHSRGMGSTLHTSVTGSNAVSDPSAALDSAGLDFTPVDGTFTISVYDSDGNFVEEQTITVDADTDSLNDIRDAINAAFVGTGNVSASVNAQNELEITASGSQSFSFVSQSGQGDTSDLLMALGINTFFEGSDGLSISVSTVIETDPTKISCGTSTAPGDNSVALAIGDLRDSLVLGGGTATLNGYYETTIGSLGADSQEAQQMKINAELLGTAFENRREMYSGVSLDEEMTEMLKFQHAYNAAAKFIATIDELIQTLLNAF